MNDKKVFFYKIKKNKDHWTIVFLENESNSINIISDNIEQLSLFFEENRDAIFVGANNYIADDKIITSLLKYQSLEKKVEYEEMSSTLPITLDITEGIVKNKYVDFYNIICSMWQDNSKIMPYDYNLNSETQVNQLITDVHIIQSLYQQEERQNFLNWKMNLINKYKLPKEAYYYSWGQLMKSIIGLELDDLSIKQNSQSTKIKIALDPKLEEALKKKNNEFLNNLHKNLINNWLPLLKLYKMIEKAIEEEDTRLIYKILQEVNDENFLIKVYEVIEKRCKEDNQNLKKLRQELIEKYPLLQGYQEDYKNKKVSPSLISPIMIDDCKINFSEQGILGTTKKDCIDTDLNSEYTYLYIDFNSFGPNILINNNWLDEVATYKERYSEIKNQRIALKAKKQPEQLYYKYILNSGLDYLIEVNTKNNENIGLSLAANGIMTMMLLYQNLKKYNVNLIECNTDGLIVRCPKENVEDVKEEVRKIEKELNLSCDVDKINKIVHFDNQNYVIQFDNEKVKHLGVFGAFQTHPLYCSGIPAVELALREYYLNSIPVGITLQKLIKEGNIKAFQEIKREKTNSKQKFIKEKGVYIPYTKSTSRYFAIEDTEDNSLYTQTKKGDYEEYKIKRGRKIKDGYYHLVVADKKLPNKYSIDLTYYLDKCYKVINNHKPYENLEILTKKKDRYSFIDIDGTLIPDKSEEASKRVFYEAASKFIDGENLDKAYQLFNSPKGGYLLQFLGLCKKQNGYGNTNNFAEFLQEKQLLGAKDKEVYKEFVENYNLCDIEESRKLHLFDDAKVLLDYLKENYSKIMIYSNWFKGVQKSKLESNGITEYNEIYTIEDTYAKPTCNGWNKVLEYSDIDRDKDIVTMFGNSTSDVVPVKIGIPYVLVNRTGKNIIERLPKTGIGGLIVPNFYSIGNIDAELQEMRKKYKKR